MKKLLIALLTLAVPVAYVLGAWTQRGRAAALEVRLASLEQRLAEAEEQGRLCHAMGRLLALMDVVARQNYAEARQLSTPFFDEVRAEAARARGSQARAALEAALRLRDPVTGSLTRGEPEALELLRQALEPMRQALGMPGTASRAAAPVVPASPLSPSPPEVTPAPIPATPMPEPSPTTPPASVPPPPLASRAGRVDHPAGYPRPRIA